MADNKKDQERAELHRSIWSIANDLRGAIEGWDFKNYVLGFMFYRYISESFVSHISKMYPGFDYMVQPDEVANRDDIRVRFVGEKGYYILPSQLFENVRARAADDPDLNIHLADIFKAIEASARGTDTEETLTGLFDDIDLNSNKLGATPAERTKRIVAILDGVANMQLSRKDNTIDAFGDAYEFLMGMYAANAGKSGGEFYTPQEVSELLTKIALGHKTSVNKVYDPACGSGSLLLQAAKVLGGDNVESGYYGQEINITTYNLCRINMFLHDVPHTKIHIALGDTLINPNQRHMETDQPFEMIVSNPPYSVKWVGDADPTLINDPRFSPAGVLAPKGKADLAFVMHCLSWLAETGTAAIVCFPGIMYRGGAEQKIRKYLVDNNFVDAVIQLPENLFFGTSIATCILVLKKNRANDTRVRFIDASKECVKVKKSNKLTPENIEKILQGFESREDIQYFARSVPQAEVQEQGYNLSVSTYVEPEDTREKIDIVKLNSDIKQIVARQNVLRQEIDKIVEQIEGPSQPSEI